MRRTARAAVLACAAIGCRIDFDAVEGPAPDAPGTYCTGRCADAATCACIDFDDAATIPPDWELLIEGTSMGTVSTTDVRSPPRALSLVVPKGPSDGMRNFATFRRGLLATNLHIAMELDYKLSYYRELDDTHTIELATVFENNDANTAIGYAWDGMSATGEWYVARSAIGLGTVVYPIPRPPTDETRWAHVRFDVTFSSTGTGHAYVAFDGVEVVHEDNLTNAPASTGPQTMVASPLAWALQGTTPQIDVRYDNVWFQVD